MKALATITLVFAAVSLFAQPKPKPAEVSVKQVNDRRTNGSFSRLTIALELPQIRSTDIAASRVLVATAVDDTGRNLLETDSREPQLESNQRGMMHADDGPPPPATVELTLKNPERKAAKIKEVRGEIELYMPGKDPNSVAEFPKFVSLAGKPLANKALKANGVEITLITPAQLEAERKRLGEARRKELKSNGLEGEDLESSVKSYLETLLKLDEGEVPVRITDPNKTIQEIVYIDAAGETKHVSKHDDEGVTILSSWGEKPKPDWKLRVSMRTSKNLVRQSFALTNVPLP